MRADISAIKIEFSIEEVKMLSDELRSAIYKIESYGKLDTSVIMLKKLSNQLDKTVERSCILDSVTGTSIKPTY